MTCVQFLDLPCFSVTLQLVVAATAGQSTDQKTYKDAGVDASSITTIVNEAASHVSFKEQLALQAKLNELQQQYEQLLQVKVMCLKCQRTRCM